MVDLSNTPRGPEAMTPDERTRHHGSKLMLAISATLRVGRAYAPQNRVFQNQLQGLLETVQAALKQHAELVIVAHGSDLYLNGVHVPVNSTSFKFQQTVIEAFDRMQIAGLRFTGGITGAELSRLFALVIEPDGPVASELMEAAAAQALEHAMPILRAALDPAATSAATAAGAARPGHARDRGAAPETPEASGRRRHAQAVHGTRLLLTQATEQAALEIRRAKRVVQPLIEGAALHEPVYVPWSASDRSGEARYTHAVSVCGLAVAIGHVLRLDRRALSDLGVAALLHDVGKPAVAGKISHPLEQFTAEERDAARLHPLEGAKLLARSTRLGPTTLHCIRAALEHHATGAGGDPTLPAGWRPSLLSEIVALADCFVSLQARVGAGAAAASPNEALGSVLGPLAARFSPALLWGLVGAVGFYPAGQIVELDDGALATVLAPNAADPARPQVRVLTSSRRERLAPADRVELRPIPPDRSVARALRLTEYPKGDLEVDTGMAQAA